MPNIGPTELIVIGVFVLALLGAVIAITVLVTSRRSK